MMESSTVTDLNYRNVNHVSYELINNECTDKLCDSPVLQVLLALPEKVFVTKIAETSSILVTLNVSVDVLMGLLEVVR